MAADWVRPVRESLLAWRGADGGWGYRPESPPFVESTVLAALALMADGDCEPGPDWRRSAAPARSIAAVGRLELRQLSGVRDRSASPAGADRTGAAGAGRRRRPRRAAHRLGR